MLKSLLIMVILTTTSIAIAIESPVLPPRITAGVPFQVAYTTGPCDSVSLNDQGLSHFTVIDDKVIDVTLSYVGSPWFVEVCIFGINTSSIPIDTLEQGDYTLLTYIASANSELPADPSERILMFETDFSVGPAASAVPTMRAPGMYLLALLLAGFGLLWLRRGQATRLLES